MLAALLCGWLVYRLVREASPEHADWAWLAFSLNPLILVEGVATAHNDLFILLAILIAAWLLVCKRPVAAMAGLVVSALIKYSTVPLVGLLGLRHLCRTPHRERLKTFVALACAGVATVLLAYLPFWAGMRGLMSTFSEPSRGVNNPVTLAWSAIFLGDAEAITNHPGLATLIAAGCFGLFALDQIMRSYRLTVGGVVTPLSSELALWALTLTVFLLLWPRLHTWYFIVPIGLAIAAGPDHRRLLVAVLGLSITSYATYFL